MLTIGGWPKNEKEDQVDKIFKWFFPAMFILAVVVIIAGIVLLVAGGDRILDIIAKALAK